MIASLFLALTVAGRPAEPRPADDLQAAIGGLVAALELDRFRFGAEDLALAVRPDRAGPSELDRVALGLLRGELARRGTAAHAVPESREVALGELDRTARRAGADWLLLLSVERVDALRVELRAELRAIDRGLWERAPAGEQVPIHAFAARTVAMGAVGALPEVPRGAVGRGTERLLSIEAPILDLAACDLDGEAPEELIVLEPSALSVYGWEGAAKLRARRGLDDLPRAAIASRDPIGAVVCEDLDGDGHVDLAFGTSRHAEGQLASFDRRAKKEPLSIVRSFPGIALASFGAQTTVFATPDPGTNRWHALVGVGGIERRAAVDLGGAFYDLASSRVDSAVAVVDLGYRVRRLDRELMRGKPVGTSGVGLVFDRSGGLVTTSSAAGADRLSASGRELALPGPIHASVALRFRDPEADDLIAAVRGADGTALWAMELRR